MGDFLGMLTEIDLDFLQLTSTTVSSGTKMGTALLKSCLCRWIFSQHTSNSDLQEKKPTSA